MSEDEKRREKADLLLAIHENKELQGQLRAKLEKHRTVLEQVTWAMSGRYLKATPEGRLSTEVGGDYPSEEELVKLVNELRRAESEGKELATRRRTAKL